MSLSSSDTKLFPLRLPPNFHGAVKSKNKYKTLHLKQQQKVMGSIETPGERSSGVSFEKKSLGLSAWEKRRSDYEVNSINNFYIQHPSRSSADNPEELRNTLGFYRRSLHKYPSKDRSKYTVFGDQKVTKDFSSTRFNLSHCKFSDNKPITLTWTTPNLLSSSKASFNNEYSSIGSVSSYSNNNSNGHSYLKPKQYRITQKIGSYERKLGAKSPTIIKIGHSSIVDTYNPK